MSSDPAPPSQSPQSGLPPVVPPTGRQFVQLFVVPALIVLVLVGLFLAGPKLLEGVNWMLGRASADSRSADQFLRDLDSTNLEVRNRAASDLAQVLLRKDELASDPEFALGLSYRLEKLLDESAEAEKAYAANAGGLTEGEKAREMKKLEADRDLITFLTGSVGRLMLPTGAPLLGRMATQTEGMETDALAKRRGQALFALATLGEKVVKYDDLPDSRKDEIEQQLEVQSSTAARDTLAYLRARRAGKQDTFGVAAVLGKTSADDDPYIRQLTALAARYWHGTPAEEKAIDDMLVALSNDAGIGWDEYQERLKRNPDSQLSRPVTKRKGFNIQAQATLVLARRGSPRTRVELLRGMIESGALDDAFVIEQKAVPAKQKWFLFWSWTVPAVPAERPDEALVVRTTLDALDAAKDLGKARPEMISPLMGLIEAREKDDNAAIAAQAKQTRLALTESRPK